MIINNKEVELNQDIPKSTTQTIKKIARTDFIYLDIETTGLDPNDSRITMIGVYVHNQNYGGVVQFFDEDEQLLMEKFQKFSKANINPQTTIVTYNGTSFDIPYIETRLKILSTDSNNPPTQYWDSTRFLDLYVVRKEELREMNSKKYASQSQTCENYGIYVPRNSSSEYIGKLFKNMEKQLKVAESKFPIHKYEYKKITSEDIANLLLHNAIDLCSLVTLHERMMEFGVLSYPDTQSTNKYDNVEAFL